MLHAKLCHFIRRNRFGNVRGLPLPLELMPLTGWPETCHNNNQHLPWTCCSVFVFQPSQIIALLAPKPSGKLRYPVMVVTDVSQKCFVSENYWEMFGGKQNFADCRGSLERSYLFFMMMSSNGNFFSRYWPFVRVIHRSPVNSPHKGRWRGALVLSLICAWLNDWVNNYEARDLRCNRAHYDVTVMLAH